MRRLELFIFLGILTGCQPGGPHKPVESARGHGAAEVGYDEVRPLFARNCAACHPSRSGPDWLDYSQAHAYVENGKLLRRAVTERSMPPPGSPQAASITEKERQTIGAWVADGGAEHASGKRPAAGGEIQVSPAVQQCVQCHGARGPDAETQPKIPRLNGQNEIYLMAQLNAFRWRQRIDPSNTMNDIASGLTDAAMAEAAHYYATQPGPATNPPHAVPAELKARFARGAQLAAERCISCHMNPGTSDPSLPLLAGQAPQYLVNELLYFRTKERMNAMMNEYARVLSDDDIRALSLFFSSAR